MSKNTQDVNRQSVASAQPGIGHNGPPPDIYVREIKKLTAIEAVLKNPKFTQTQALILIGLIVRSDETYRNAYPGATTLALYAKVSRTQTIFKALSDLEDQFKVINRESRGQGRSNSYNVLPQRVLDEVAAAYEERKAAKAAERAAAKTKNAERTELEKPSAVSAPGRQTDRDAERTPTRCAERTTYPVIDPVDKKGYRASGRSYWQNALNPSSDVLYEAGRLTLVNGMRVHWLEEFGGDEKDLDLALQRAAQYVQENSNKTLDVQVSGQLSRIVQERRDKDRRYAAAAASKPQQQQAPRGETARERKIREASEYEARLDAKYGKQERMP
jgi:hypothetical protein